MSGLKATNHEDKFDICIYNYLLQQFRKKLCCFFPVDLQELDFENEVSVRRDASSSSTTCTIPLFEKKKREKKNTLVDRS